MNLIRFFFISFLSLGFVYPLQATISDELTLLLQHHRIYQAHFIQTKNIPFLKKPFISSGTLFFHSQEGILWQTKKPLEQILLLTPAGIFEVVNQRVVPLNKSQTSNLFGSQLYDFFKGDLTSLEKTFVLQIFKEYQRYSIKLIPRGDSLKKFLTLIQIEIDAEGKLQQITITEPNQSETKIKLSEYHSLEKLGPSELRLYEQIQSL